MKDELSEDHKTSLGRKVLHCIAYLHNVGNIRYAWYLYVLCVGTYMLQKDCIFFIYFFYQIISFRAINVLVLHWTVFWFRILPLEKKRLETLNIFHFFFSRDLIFWIKLEFIIQKNCLNRQSHSNTVYLKILRAIIYNCNNPVRLSILAFAW